MSVLLPASPGFRAGKPRLIGFGSLASPPSGGPDTLYNHLGNRFGLDVECSTSRADGAGRIMVSRLIQGLTRGVLYAFPQDLNPGPVGTGVVVDGSGWTGITLPLRGFPPGYAALEGQFFSLIHGGQRYVHMFAADAIAAGNGTLTATIEPMLRIAPTDGELCEVAKPIIEGFLTGQNLEWQLQAAPWSDISFTIRERA